MTGNETERRANERRCVRAGGRRSTDLPRRPMQPPECPRCRNTGGAVQAGEADGGWWFVCVVCDHLWDERSRAAPQLTAYASYP
jgi:hypothetical protein